MSQVTVGGKRILVLGGGMSGLSFIHYLRNFTAAFKKQHLISNVTLIEANDYMGGSVKTNVFDDGIVHELGPRSIRTQGVRAQNTILLMDELGLTKKLLTVKKDSPSVANRFIYNNNTMYKLQGSLGKLLTKVPNSNTRLISVVYRDMFKASKMDLDKYPYRDPSLYEFIEHRFGPDAAEQVLDPIMRGITAGDARKLSTRALFSDLLDKEQTYGSVISSVMRPPVTKMPHDELFPNEILTSELLDTFQKDGVLSFNLNSGLQTIPEHLSNSLLNTNQDGLISIFNQSRVQAIEFNKDDLDKAPCSVIVKTVDGDHVRIEADHIVSTIPAKNLAQIIPESMPLDQREALADVLNIKHAPVGCVCLEYRDIKNRPKVLDSFGFLTHSKAGSKVLGISFDSAMYPEIDKPHNSFRMTCMMGGSWFKEIMGTDNPDQVDDAQLEEIALSEVRKILKINDDPHRVSSLLWKTGIAQYEPGHKERLAEARKKIENLSLPLTLLGQSYDGVAVNDVVFTARMAADKYIKSLEEKK